jgi:archaellum biogenesis protein FlaJ (TadC family)
MSTERLSRFDNMHILFWLIKDMSWCLMSKTIGTIMIVPTVVVALVILVRSREHMTSFVHNLAVLFWISANSMWMVGEMFCQDCTKPYAVWLFSAGMGVLLVYYVYLLKCRFLR